MTGAILTGLFPMRFLSRYFTPVTRASSITVIFYYKKTLLKNKRRKTPRGVIPIKGEKLFGKNMDGEDTLGKKPGGKDWGQKIGVGKTGEENTGETMTNWKRQGRKKFNTVQLQLYNLFQEMPTCVFRK